MRSKDRAIGDGVQEVIYDGIFDRVDPMPPCFLQVTGDSRAKVERKHGPSPCSPGTLMLSLHRLNTARRHFHTGIKDKDRPSQSKLSAERRDKLEQPITSRIKMLRVR